MDAAPHRPDYPPAERLDLVDVLHGHKVPDPYRWLEDPADERTRTWADAQRDLFTAHAATWPGRERLSGRIRALLGAGVVGVPVWRGPRRFFLRRDGEQEHAVLIVADPDPAGGPDTERVLIDPIALDPDGLTTLDSWQPSIEGDRLAYQLSEGGTEESVLRILDVATGTVLDGPLDRLRYSPVAWLPGGRAFYYVRRLDPTLVPEPERQFHRRVYLHQVGADPATDVEVFGAGLDLRSYFGVSVSRDGRWLTVSAATGTAPRNDVWIADLTADPADATVPVDSPWPTGTAGPAPVRQPDGERIPDAAGARTAPRFRPVALGLDARVGTHVGRDGRLYVSTDLDAPRGRLAVTTPADPGPDTWVDLIAQDPEAVLEDFAILDGPDLAEQPVLLVSWTRHAVAEISAHHLDDGTRLPDGRDRVPLPGLGSLGTLVARPEGGHEAWFSYTDHTTPPHVYRIVLTPGAVPEMHLHARPPGTVTVPPVRTHQISYPSADGTTVRMFVIARADALDPQGRPRRPQPTILYGYGGFGLPLNPGYSASILAWVESGGVYAVANLRGGSEEGEDWHRAGMLAEKHHVFEDFHGAAERLVGDGWTTAEQLTASGGSNGGLLVGAALTQRPDLYAAVICSAPLLDMVRYERFGLGVTWNVEYGTADDPEQLGWLLSYSPYHHVRDGVGYPAVLFTVFDSDTRVDPLHARKMCAALQSATSSAHPVLLRAEGDVGHGARAVSRSVSLSADTLTFAAAICGLHLAPQTP
jgi:prolyl oligopeptidase